MPRKAHSASKEGKTTAEIVQEMKEKMIRDADPKNMTPAQRRREEKLERYYKAARKRGDYIT